MNEVERRLSVQEKIEELEKNKVTLHPPLFDSKFSMSVDKKSPETEASSLDTQKNTIRVIKTSDAENVTVEVSLGEKDAFRANAAHMDTGEKTGAKDGEKMDKEKEVDTSYDPGQGEKHESENEEIQEKEKLVSQVKRGESPEEEIKVKFEKQGNDLEIEETQVQGHIEKVVNQESDSGKGETLVQDKLENDMKRSDPKNGEIQVHGKQENAEKDTQRKEADKKKKKLTENENTHEREPKLVEKEGKGAEEGDRKDDAKETIQVLATQSDDKMVTKLYKPLTDAAIDEIIAKHPKLKQDDKKLQKLLDFFFSMDEEKYGYFTVQQLAYKLRSDGHYLYDSEIASMFADLDSDCDLLVSLDEYLTEMSKSPRRELREEELKEIFDHLDVDKDGYLSRRDFEIGNVNSEDYEISIYHIDDLFSRDHTGNDDRLDFEEFCLYLKKGRSRRRRGPASPDNWLLQYARNQLHY